MKTQIALRQLVSVLMSGVLGLGGLCYGVRGQGQRKPVIISFGQPNIWSLEQAHYLLARMHERSLDLASRTPSDVDLDPNATNGSRVNTLKTLLEAGVSFDQGLGLQNQLQAQASQHSFARRQALEARKDQRQLDLQKVNGELAGLNFEREQMNANSASDAEKKLKDVQIKSKTAEQAALTTEITDINSEIEKNPVPTGTPTAVAVPTPFDKSKFGDSVVDKMLGDEGLKNELRKDVRLAATTMLDNHIQMQYEIIAKQLTLLRDEVGPNERLVFLELPQSLYTTPGKSEEMLAQVWWSVTGVTAKAAPASSNASKAKVREYQLAIAEGSGQLSNKKRERDDVESEMRRRIARGATDVAQLRARSAVLNADITDKQQQLIVLSEELNYAVSRQAADEAKRLHPSRDVVETDPAKLIKKIRSVDLIPRQSSLNVNDVQDTVKSGALTAAFSFLFGLGAKVSYQRQRELYEQYIHQDIFASSFGKGTRDFGWTFGPLPGSKRIAPGIKTTYAVMVIPENVEELKFSVSGCYFPRKQLAPQNFADTANADWKSESRVGKYRCESPAEQIAVHVPIARDDSFWVTGVSYKSGAKPGQRITVSLDGRDFSTQTGILIDGVALRPSVGVAQPLLAARKDAASAAGGDGITGEFERLNRNQLILTFRMPDDYKPGTPTITVVSPDRAIDLNSNDVLLRINGNPGQLLRDAEFMFGKRPEDELTLTGLDIFRNPAMGRRVFSVLSGVKLPKDFDPSKVDLRINGVKAVAVAAADKPVVLHAGSDFYQMEFDLPNSDTIDVSIVSEGAYATKSFPNPLRLNITEVSVIASDKKGEDTVLTLKVKGAGFGDKPEISVKGVMNPNVIPISSGEAAIELKNPPALMVITVTNPDSHASATTLLTRPTAKKEE